MDSTAIDFIYLWKEYFPFPFSIPNSIIQLKFILLLYFLDFPKCLNQIQTLSFKILLSYSPSHFFDSNNNCLYNKFLFSLPTSQSTIIIVFVKKILLILGLTGSNFDPLGEFVDGDQQVCEAPGCLLQATDEIQTPHRKQPSDRYCL
jgi:hypothetical protein